jgi:Rps23 Pro-64 3,4-dihydroxylase Tpa1-like proline 4-hydroxylase
MGQNEVANAASLSAAWAELANDLLSAQYRAAMSTLTGMDLRTVPMEVNVYHYGPGSLLGPHRDLPEKMVVQVFYFNADWDAKDGGCLSILNSADSNDLCAAVTPFVGNSAAFIRSENSWHEVTQVSKDCRQSRRSMTVTFYCHGAVSSMWPAGEEAALHTYAGLGKS